jgi:hypothetical protein
MRNVLGGDSGVVFGDCAWGGGDGGFAGRSDILYTAVYGGGRGWCSSDALVWMRATVLYEQCIVVYDDAG